MFRRCDRSFPFELKDSSNLENDLVGTSSEFLLINLSVIYRSKKEKNWKLPRYDNYSMSSTTSIDLSP